jgi:serine/threonine-protein kinase
MEYDPRVKARIHVVGGPATGQVHDLERPQSLIVGRAADAHLSVPTDNALSRQHMALDFDPPKLRARDLQSKHGMLVNGQRMTTADLVNGDRVQVGETVLWIELLPDAVAATMPATMPTTVGRTARGWSPPAPKGKLVTVRCHCGVEATNEPARPGEEDVVFVCASCQNTYAAAPLLPDGYALVRVLGRGAMGSVYLARHATTGAVRAIKQILPKAAMSADMRKMFVREATVQAALDHPNIVRVYELVEPVPGAFSLVMEYVDGESADCLLRGSRRTSPALAVAIGCQALDGLAHAHKKQIVHRDIKEANLMLVRSPDGTVVVKVADFGLAKNFQESGASGMTQDGALGGTLPYMSNEQLLDYKYVKPPADIYALGATLYRLLTGEFPRDYRDGDNWIRTSLEQPIVPLSARAAGRALPAALCEVIEKALEPDVKRRYQSAVDMRKALAAVPV